MSKRKIKLKVKKIKKAVKAKPKAVRPKKKKELGQKIEVKMINEPIGVPENENEENLLQDFDFSDFSIDPSGQEDIADDLVAPVIIAEEILEPQIDQVVAEEIQPEEAEEEIEQALAEEYLEPQPFENLSPKQKNIILYIALTCIMITIVGFWFFGMRASLSQSLKNITLPTDDASFDQIKNDFSDIGQGVEQFKDELNQKKIEYGAAAQQVIIDEAIKYEVTDKMKERIENLNVNSQ